jgi:glycosyltransferase involved in cell wall biosynthesis
VVKRVAFAVPGDLATPTGGYAYDRRMIAELQSLGWQVDVIGLGDGFPRPSAETKATAQTRVAMVERGCPIVVDGLAFGALPEAANALREQSPLVALVHHPLAFETGLTPERAEALFASERDALAAARAVIVTSPSTARLLTADYEVPEELITVVPPGTDRVAPATGSSDGVVRLVSVGAVVPRKGFDVLIAALAMIAGLPWHLTIAGDRTRDLAAAARLDADIAALGLQHKVSVLGAQPDARIAALYAGADLFVLASRFEGYSMAYAEAIAHGLPIIGTTGGATIDTVPAEAGVLVEPDDVNALARALRLMIENTDERRWFATGARAAAERLPTWPDSARLFAGVIEAVA